MSHFVLLGDSVFDNGAYVPGQDSVIEQLRAAAGEHTAELLACDGDGCAEIASQAARIPAGATHLFLSVGGNDALEHLGLQMEATRSMSEAMTRLSQVQEGFRARYAAMLQPLAAKGLPLAVCTIYDSIPAIDPLAKTALSLFNDAILREAFAIGIPVIDLRFICLEIEDFSAVSPIEPSHVGGAKIVRAIHAAAKHDFAARRASIYF